MGVGGGSVGDTGDTGDTGDGPADLPSLRRTALECDREFTDALTSRDVDRCIAAILDLEEAIVAWSTDTDVSDHADQARSMLRGMVVRLGTAAKDGLRDPREVVAPYIMMLMEWRTRARKSRDYATSDRIRDGLAEAGVEVRDTPDGPAWDLTDLT